MGQEETKIVKVITMHGQDIGIKTRMPAKEIHAEVMGGDERHPLFCVFEGLTDENERVEVCICRDHLSAYIILPYKQSMIARPQMVPPQLVKT